MFLWAILFLQAKQKGSLTKIDLKLTALELNTVPPTNASPIYIDR